MTADNTPHDPAQPVVPPDPVTLGLDRRFRWSADDRLLPLSPFMHTCMVALPAKPVRAESTPVRVDEFATVRIDVVVTADPDIVARIAGLLSKFGVMPELLTVRRTGGADEVGTDGARLTVVVAAVDRDVVQRIVSGCRKIIGVSTVLVGAKEQ